MNNNIKTRKNKYLSRDEKSFIEGYLSSEIKNNLGKVNETNKKVLTNTKKKLCKIYKEIAEKLDRSVRTIKREIFRGKYIKKDELYNEVYSYSYTISNNKREKKKLNKQTKLKIDNNMEVYKYISKQLKNKYSPYAALEKAKRKEYRVDFNLKTLYNYINVGLFESEGVRLDKLPYKRNKSKIKHHRAIKKANALSIEMRATEINDRTAFGHWEIDCVVGTRSGKSTCLLVLTERVSRYEKIYLLESKKAENVEKILKKVLVENKQPIKSITSDNGSEFIGVKDIDKMLDWFYAHPFCSGERGSNENNNKLIRRHIKKGKSMVNLTIKRVKKIESFINNYPRKLFEGKTSKEVYNEYMKKA
ncbi:IS30 family transposase [Oceanivirga salmonicida]|uniref:IS30 family transposase n=2 Tax=Oceanivirga salmonicida TaxID=1769291 RepID=UPI000830A3F7|nr:IS30 family transposase [Oceanivirga salmonicida]